MMKEQANRENKTYLISRTGQTLQHNNDSGFYKIYYLISGNKRFFIGETVYQAQSGDVVLIPPGVLYRTANVGRGQAEQLRLLFREAFVHCSAHLLSCFETHKIAAESLREIFLAIEQETNRGDLFSEGLIRNYMTIILARLSRLCQEGGPVQPSETNSIIQEAAKYIADHYDDDMTLRYIAGTFAMSESHFSRKFKAVTGFGVREYMTLVRIRNAQRMILQTGLPMTEIAMRCGFHNSSYFTAVFKKVKGTTPLQFRKATCLNRTV